MQHEKQSMPRDTCDRTCTCPHTCKMLSTSKKSPVPTSLLIVQSHMPSKNFVVVTATLVTATFCFHNSALSCFIPNDAFEMVQQQETLYLGNKTLGSYVQFQIIQSNHSCRQGHTFFRAWTGNGTKFLILSSFSGGFQIIFLHPMNWKRAKYDMKVCRDIICISCMQNVPHSAIW